MPHEHGRRLARLAAGQWLSRFDAERDKVVVFESLSKGHTAGWHRVFVAPGV
jgi:hypothetical protein